MHAKSDFNQSSLPNRHTTHAARDRDAHLAVCRFPVSPRIDGAGVQEPLARIRQTVRQDLEEGGAAPGHRDVFGVQGRLQVQRPLHEPGKDLQNFPNQN